MVSGPGRDFKSRGIRGEDFFLVAIVSRKEQEGSRKKVNLPSCFFLLPFRNEVSHGSIRLRQIFLRDPLNVGGGDGGQVVEVVVEPAIVVEDFSVPQPKSQVRYAFCAISEHRF